MPGFGAEVDFGKFEGFNFGDSAASGQFKGNGEGTGNEQKAATNHANLPTDRNGAPVQQDMANAFAQLMRTQGAIVGSQQAMIKGADGGEASLTRAEPIQLNGVSAANGTNQLSQTTKAVPTAPPRPPGTPAPHCRG